VYCFRGALSMACFVRVVCVQVGLMVNPPKPGDESYELYVQERDAILSSLKRYACEYSCFLSFSLSLAWCLLPQVRYLSLDFFLSTACLSVFETQMFSCLVS
jgi:hypothetical protein